MREDVLKSGALDQIRHGLDAVFDRVRGVLEVVVENRTAIRELEGAAVDLKQAAGVLEIAEYRSAALLVREMEALARAMAREGALGLAHEEACGLLMRAVLQLPGYFDYRRNGGRDVPLALQPLVRELRAARKASPMPEGALFFPPEIPPDTPSPDAVTQTGDETPAEHARRVRPLFQQHLLAVFRSRDLPQSLGGIQSILVEVQALSGSPHERRFWWVARACVECLRSREEALSAPEKDLLGILDRRLKTLAEGGAAAQPWVMDDEALRAMLWHIAVSGCEGPLASTVREAWALAGAVPDEEESGAARESLRGGGPGLFDSVAVAVREDLATVEDALDMFVHSERRDLAMLGGLGERLGHIAETFGLLGFDEARDLTLRERDALSGIVEGRVPLDDGALVNLAGMMLNIKSVAGACLSESARSLPGARKEEAVAAHEFRAVESAAVKEALAEMRRVKEALFDFLSISHDPRVLEGVPGMLGRIGGMLAMLGESRATPVLSGLSEYVDGRLLGGEGSPDIAAMEALADTLSGLELYLATLEGGHGDPTDLFDFAAAGLARLLSAEASAAGAVPEAPEVPPAPAPVPSRGMPWPAFEGEPDPEILEIFLEEADDECARIAEILPLWLADPGDVDTLATVRRAFHTLKGSGRVVNAKLTGEFAWAIENLLNRVISGSVTVDEALRNLMREASDALPAIIGQLRGGPVPPHDVGAIIARAQALAAPAAAPLPAGEPVPEEGPEEASRRLDPVLYEIFSNETVQHLAALEGLLQSARATGSGLAVSEILSRTLHTLNGSALAAGVDAISGAVGAYESFIEVARATCGKRSLPKAAADVLEALIAHVRAVIHALGEAGGTPPDPAPLCERIAGLPGEFAPAPQPVPAPPVVSAAPAEAGVLDHELVEIFLEEAAELLDACDEAVQHWRAEPEDRTRADGLMRHLHTLKGSARTAGLKGIGDLCHAFESLVGAVVAGKREPDPALFSAIHQTLDRLGAMLQHVRVGEPPPEAGDLVGLLEGLCSGFESEQPAAQELPPAEPLAPAPSHAVPQIPGGREFIRVSPDLLDRMVNGAGELGVCEARMEQQLRSVGGNLGELSRTVIRLREQLRRLELDTEAQVLANVAREFSDEIDRKGFDLLEMDRYSSIQQLSRAISESVSDLAGIQQLLAGQLRDVEAVLSREIRLSSELQEELVRTRLVRFDSLAPRFRRLVRQAAQDLGREAAFDVCGEDVEVDRRILEAMVGPLEHMLRNAVAHGTEPPEQRRAAGKPEVGRITLTLLREGAEVVIHVEDDGAGINVAAVRARALRDGRLTSEEAQDDAAVIRMILESGFSTAGEVSQVAGRGVGMDVVNSEVTRMGGTLTVETRSGQGTRFTIRFPVTLAVARVLIVQAGREVYAIPFAAIEGVTRIRAGEDAESCEYGGEHYDVVMLHDLVGIEAPQRDTLSHPFLLIRAGGRRVALRVDALVTNREAMVKPLGPWLAPIRGFLGGTLLGDGRVALVLDIAALLRIGGAVARETPSAAAPAPEGVPPFVLVVDDSLTMRRVTGRLLERNGYRVGTARDGMEALDLMRQAIPDLVLLDIEMPRMDGYELAAHIRKDPRLAAVPIAMVTSRTGAKHRDRAISLGVNAYLGKPWQEVDLLRIVRNLIGRVPEAEV